MRLGKALGIGVLAVALGGGSASLASAQISVQIGAPPVCPYGYYDYAPYNCAPYGYYGPEWFNGGVFIGAGPWFHGPHHFHGYVNNHYDPHYGYHGPMPHHGEAAPHGHPMAPGGFHGNEMHDGQGHVMHGGGGPHGGPH